MAAVVVFGEEVLALDMWQVVRTMYVIKQHLSFGQYEYPTHSVLLNRHERLDTKYAVLYILSSSKFIYFSIQMKPKKQKRKRYSRPPPSCRSFNYTVILS